jgi:hypothetical protein
LRQVAKTLTPEFGGMTAGGRRCGRQFALHDRVIALMFINTATGL